MTQAEKLRIIADAMEGKCKIELKFCGKWFGVTFDGEKSFIFSGCCNYLYELLGLEIRIAKSLPLLSDADADFAEKYLPKDWWIGRDKDKDLFLYKEKPYRLSTYSYWICEEPNVKTISHIDTFPKFESIKWENDDCYTIQELLDYYRDQKK